MRRRNMSEGDRAELLRLPDTLTLLEEQIDDVVKELGSDQFSEIPGATCKVVSLYFHQNCLHKFCVLASPSRKRTFTHPAGES